MPRNIYKQIANAESSPLLSETASTKQVSASLYIYISYQKTVNSRIRNQKIFFLVFRETSKIKKSYIKSC